MILWQSYYLQWRFLTDVVTLFCCSGSISTWWTGQGLQNNGETNSWTIVFHTIFVNNLIILQITNYMLFFTSKVIEYMISTFSIFSAQQVHVLTKVCFSNTYSPLKFNRTLFPLDLNWFSKAFQPNVSLYISLVLFSFSHIWKSEYNKETIFFAKPVPYPFDSKKRLSYSYYSYSLMQLISIIWQQLHCISVRLLENAHNGCTQAWETFPSTLDAFSVVLLPAIVLSYKDCLVLSAVHSPKSFLCTFNY